MFPFRKKSFGFHGEEHIGTYMYGTGLSKKRKRKENLRILRSQYMWLSEGLCDHCGRSNITSFAGVTATVGVVSTAIYVEGLSEPLIYYVSLSNNEKESSRSGMAPVSLEHEPGLGGSADEADTGVIFVITN